MPMSRYRAIPAEMRTLPNWVLFKLIAKDGGKTDKIPYQANGHKASVMEPTHWVTFDAAFNAMQFGTYDGLGFVFTNTPYTGIDLDDPKNSPNYQADYDRQVKVYKEFDSYSERSPSGKGCHIIVRGKVPSGIRRAFIEIYPSGRFFTMTGDVINEQPIKECNELLIQLWRQMGGETPIVNSQLDSEQIVSDEEIITQASSASNGDKFDALYKGEWQGLYPSQSEADFALIDIIAFYTHNREQIRRIFDSSKLYRKGKSDRKDYVPKMITRSFDRIPPSINFDGVEEAFGRIAQRLVPVAHNGSDVGSNPTASTIPYPPGLVGDIAKFIYNSAQKPVHEIAIAGAIGLMAGICGKAYNVSDTGLNQYILMIAATGRGKEAMSGGISKLINAVRLQVPVAGEFIGPSVIASKQGLHRWLTKNSPCFVSIIGEFGLTLKAMSSPKAHTHQIELQAALLDIYHKSGSMDNYGGSAYSDHDKNIVAIQAPAFSILGESTPETFYSVLDEQMISSGLLPRFTIIEYNGPRVPSNTNKNVVPSIDLITNLGNLMAQAKTVISNRTVIEVQLTDDAMVLANKIDSYADDKMNGTDKQFVHHLWNRAHIKALKLAAIVAVGINIYNPIITVECLNWAMFIVDNDIKSLSSKFESGEIGANTDELLQVKETTRVVREYVTKDFDQVSKYRAKKDQHKAKVINNSYLQQRLSRLGVFKNDRIGATKALKRTIELFIDNGMFIELKGKDLQKFNTTERCFVIHSGILQE